MAKQLKSQKRECADRLREIRINMNISQEQFAECLDISLSAYKKLESADNGISIKVLRQLKEKFSVSSDYILYGDYKNVDDVFDFIQNCDEKDKMNLFLRLARYFITDKKRIFVETKDSDEVQKLDEVKKFLDME